MLVVDGNNLAHRCKYAYSLSNGGVDVSVTYGFLKVLHSMMKKYSPLSVVVCWDGGIPEFRRKALPCYKANRKRDWDAAEYEDFIRQLTELETILPTMGVVSVRRIGTEADDLMYHISKIVDYNEETIIVSSDKDMFQTLRFENVKVYNPSREVLYDRKMIEDATGVDILYYVDWRSIQGDSSDNIPGIPGVGEKTATKLFSEYKSLSGIFAANIPGKLGINIHEFGSSNACRNTYIMNLHQDRTGAIISIVDAISEHARANPRRVKKYFLENSFLSFIGSSFMNDLGMLTVPPLRPNIKTPINIGRRDPV